MSRSPVLAHPRDPITGRMLPVDVGARIQARVIEEDRGYASPCWIWTGVAEAGYGRIWHNGRFAGVHRVAYELSTGQTVPADMEIDHLCRVKLCVRASHMEVVTPRENVRRSDSPAARNARLERCRRGHPFDGTNTAGARTCRACSRIRTAEHRARRRAAA